MLTDKADLEFHGKKQSVYCYELLKKFCEQVFISSRDDQREQEGIREFPQIHDQTPYLNIGPLGGILSAMTQYPQVDWLVLAVDLPFVSEQTVKYLMENRDTNKEATAYTSTSDGLPEPLCAIYESHSRPSLMAYFHEGKLCPRQYLKGADTKLVDQTDKKSLDNVNDPEEYKKALEILGKKDE